MLNFGVYSTKTPKKNSKPPVTFGYILLACFIIRIPLTTTPIYNSLTFLLAPKKNPSAKKSSPLTVLCVPLFAGRGALAADDGFPHSAAPVAGLFRNPPAVFFGELPWI